MGNQTAKYKNDYVRENYDTYYLQLPKGTKAEWQEEAKKRGLSLSALIQEAVKQYIGNN